MSRIHPIKNNKYLKSVHYHLFYCFFNKIIGVITMNKINDNRFNTTDENNLASVYYHQYQVQLVRHSL
jgi:hypothetical protein